MDSFSSVQIQFFLRIKKLVSVISYNKCAPTKQPNNLEADFVQTDSISIKGTFSLLSMFLLNMTILLRNDQGKMVVREGSPSVFFLIWDS